MHTNPSSEKRKQQHVLQGHHPFHSNFSECQQGRGVGRFRCLVRERLLEVQTDCRTSVNSGNLGSGGKQECGSGRSSETSFLAEGKDAFQPVAGVSVCKKWTTRCKELVGFWQWLDAFTHWLKLIDVRFPGDSRSTLVSAGVNEAACTWTRSSLRGVLGC